MRVLGTGELVEYGSILVEKVLADHMRGRAVHKVPVVQSVMSIQVKAEQSRAVIWVQLLLTRLKIHDGYTGHPDLVAVVIE